MFADINIVESGGEYLGTRTILSFLEAGNVFR